MADLDQPIVGFGFDVEADPLLLAREATAVGPDWIPVSALDGDDLAGLAAPPGVSGVDVLLATLALRALVGGASLLSLGITPDDPSEGFALQGIGAFETVSFAAPLGVRIVPEPASGLLLGAGLLGVAAQRRGTRRARRRAAHGPLQRR